MLEYNSYLFNDYTHVTVEAVMQYDEAERTVTYHRYKVHAETTITANPGDANVGDHFRRIRQVLSKAGKSLTIDHVGFGPRIQINALTAGGVRDVDFGPKPRVIRWQPVGDTLSVEVTWECEFCIPTCDGQSGVRFSGIAAMNYSVGFRINQSGYTSRFITGYIEIALTRAGRSLPDTADAYRELIIIPRPVNFTRETTWNISASKKRADFSITDTEIESPNPYPAGVISIRGNHRVGWSRRALATLPNTISCTIQLAPGVTRGRAWEVFRLIAATRMAYAVTPRKVFLESLDVDESLFENSISFSLTYRIYFTPETSAIGELFSATGLFSALPGTWQEWSTSIDQLQSHRGTANIHLNPSDDQIIDLCSDVVIPNTPPAYQAPSNPGVTYQRLCNDKPPPGESYVRFEGAFTSIEDNPTVVQISVGRDDLNAGYFDINEPTGSLGSTDEAAEIKRIIESAPAAISFEWTGYAERVGYNIPKPGKIQIGNITLIRKGKGVFRQKFLGTHFCQPVYGAAWKLTYVVDKRPPQMKATDGDPVNAPAE